MYKKAQHTVATQNLIADGVHIVVGVSGGPDSIALLDVLVRIAKRKRLTLTIAHVIYGIRGDEARADCQRVDERAKHYKLPCIIDNQVAQTSLPHTPSEETMRTSRYAFFDTVKNKVGADLIAVGHTRDDLVETFFLHLLRGTGLAGLTAMRYQRDNIIRPLLDITRIEVEEYCTDNNLPTGHDITNDDTIYTRNRIRHTLLPLLAQEFNPNIVSTIARTAHSISDDYTFMQAQMQAVMIAHNITDDNVLTFSAAAFCALDPAIARLMLHKFAQKLTNQAQSPLSFGTCEQIRTAIISTKNKAHTIHTNVLIFTRNGDIVRLMRTDAN